jgi:S1-C subfamily serine protease
VTDLNSKNFVGNVILAQLGGVNILRLMLGAREVYALSAEGASPGGLQFAIPSNLSRPRINKIVIRLNGGDLYDVDFLSIRRGKDGFTCKTVASEKDIFNSELRACIERNTGLVLTMPRMVG